MIFFLLVVLLLIWFDIRAATIDIEKRCYKIEQRLHEAKMYLPPKEK